MKMRLLFSMLLVVGMISCSNDDGDDGFRLAELNADTSVIFGEIYGQCGGDCRALYLLTDETIFEDANVTSDFNDFVNTIFKSEPLSSGKFELSKSLLEISEEVFESNSDDLGNQTVADFDYFAQITINNESKIWVFDEVSENVDEEIKQYFQSLIQINTQLKD